MSQPPVPCATPAPRPASQASAAVQSCPLQKKKKKIKIRATLLFDGTLNNRVNTASYNSWNGRPARTRGEAPGSGSYTGDFTNIAKLQWALSNEQPGYDNAIKIYIEGIGTTNNGADDIPGKAYGTGQTGVIDKVTAGLNRLYPQIASLVDDRETTTVEVHLDSFGFSRGAAAARHYIYRAMKHASDNLHKRLTAQGIQVTAVKFRYCGLFDTVSSYEPNNYRNWRNPQFDNDVAELKLNAISEAERTFHLASADEHRINFSLTNIKSAGAKGQQIYCPGVHSDVGGGYRDNDGENDNQVYDIDVAWSGAAEKAAYARERAWILAGGWYTTAELSGPNFFNEIYGTRQRISNHYARIPLQIMGEDAKKLQLAFDAQLESGATNVVPPALAGWHGTVKGLAAQVPTVYFGASNNNLRALRHRYLHFSAHYVSSASDQGMQPRFTGDDPVNGRRWRKVIDG